MYVMPGATPASSPVPETFTSTVDRHAPVPRVNPEATSTPVPALKHSLRRVPAPEYPWKYKENLAHLPHQNKGQALAPALGLISTDWRVSWEDQDNRCGSADQGSGRVVPGRETWNEGATSSCIFHIDDGELDIEQIENN